MDQRNLTEAQARALWERAARLHAEAAARELTAGGSPDEAFGEDDDPAESSYSLDVVRRSAVEAGIPAEFVDRALSEVQSDDRGKIDDWAESYVGDATPTLSVRRTIQAPPEEVYAAMQRVLPGAPFKLALAGTDGRPPLDGGTLYFDVPYGTLGFGGSSGHQAVTDLRQWGDIKQIRIRLSGVESDPAITEVEMWASLANTRRVNFWSGNAVGGLLGATGGLLTGLVAAAVVDPVTAVQLAGVFGTAGATAVGTMATSRFWWRPIYRYALRRGVRGMERILDALVVDLQTDGAFTRGADRGTDASEGEGPGELLEGLGFGS